ncbi:MAG: coproporphyrinogen III oxidase, partial [Planctomycetes bacterium]|nr:coproporphyrinogen III oxidase [Planctomycetota bacterium]
MIAPRMNVDLEVFRRYAGLSLPRHVSYPMPTAWHDMDEAEAVAMFAASAARNPVAGLSLYLHIPFCANLCRYCGCTRVIVKKDSSTAARRVEEYLTALTREVDQTAGLVGPGRTVRHIHWGGGSPTYLDEAAIEQIHRKIVATFAVSPDAEIAMEVDPRTAPADK